MELAALDYYYLVQEWQQLSGGRIQKIYLKDRLLVMQVYAKQNYEWLFTDGKSFLSSAKLAFPASPPGFCMFLRKRIQGFRIKKIELLGFDRIIKITVDAKEGELELIIELLDKMNVLLCKDNNIISTFETHSYADRTIRGGTQYVPPPARQAPWSKDLSALEGKEAAKTLAVELGLGGKYAEEVCARKGIDRKDKLTKEQLERVQKELEKLKSSTLHPVHNETEALPYPFKSKPGDWISTNTYSAAIDAIEAQYLETAEERVEEKAAKELLMKHEKVRAAQEKRMKELEEAITNNQLSGEKIYERYTELKELLEGLKQDWKKLTFKELQDKYKDHKIVKALRKDGTVELEL